MTTTIRKSGFLLLVYFLFNTYALAQGKLVSWGPKAGLNLSSASEKNAAGSSLSGVGYGMSYVAGVGADIGLGPVGLLVDVLYANRKITYGTEFPGITTETTQSINYLQLPVQAKLGLGFTYFTGGLYYSMALSDVSTQVGSGAATTQTLEQVGLKSSDLGLIAGVGLDFPVPAFSPRIEARFLYGMSNQKKAPTASEAAKNLELQVLAGLYF